MFAAFWGEQQAAVALRRGGLYLYALAARRFDSLRRGQVGSLGVEEKRLPRRQSDDHHFGSLLVVALTTGTFMLVTWIATKALFVFLQTLPSLESRG
jgi:hypothetical protein